MQHFRTLGGGRTDQPSGRVETPQGRPARRLRLPLVRSHVVNQALKFAIVGGLGTVVNMTALYVLHRWAHLPLVMATALAVELAVVHNYLLNDRWTFGARAPTVRRFLKFNASVLGGLGVNVFVVWVLVRGGVHFLVANAFGIGAAFAVNFASSTGWVWGRQSR
jgi:putative flippase GtrA